MEDISGMALLENPQEQQRIEESHQEKKAIREDVDRRIEYSKAVLDDAEKRGRILPKTNGELREKLESKAKELLEPSEKEKEHKENVPGIVLREKDDAGWEAFGWKKEDKEKVEEKLNERLKIGKDKVENVMQMLLASGKNAKEVLVTLNDDSQWEYYSTEEGQAAIAEIVNNGRHPLGGNIEAAKKYLYLKEKLDLNDETNKMNDVYIQRFVLDDEFRSSLDEEYDSLLPRNLFDLAWNIMYHDQKKYGVNGKFPVLQMQVEKDSNGKTHGRYVVDQGNFVHWLRDKMFYRYDAFETDEVPQFFNVITIDKGAYSTVSLNTMIFDKTRYFKDETGHEWDELYNQVFIEPFMLQFDRTYALEYNKAKGSDDDLVKTYTAMADQSKFTRKIIGQSMLDRSLMLPLDFKGKESDAKVGEALLTMYLAYYNLADFDALQEILGKDSAFFKKEAWIGAAQEIASRTMKVTGGAHMSTVFGSREYLLEKAFNADGTIKDKKKFIELVNPYYQEDVPQTLAKALGEMLQTAVKEKFKSKQGIGKELDEDSLHYAWLKAYSWMYFTGGLAKNNFVAEGGPAGYLAETKYHYTDAYRLKYETYGGAGNPYTNFMFKQMGVPLLEGMKLENAFERRILRYDEKGNPVFDDNPKTQYRYKTPMEVMLEMRRTTAGFENQIKALQATLPNKTGSEAKEIERQITELEEKTKTYTKSFASTLEFGDNAMAIWAKNLLARGSNLYNVVMKGHETEFDKFMKYDSVLRGVSFDREKWQDAMQSKLITPLRYFFEANGATQLNMKVRAPVLVGWNHGKPQWEFKEQYLGERMLGHQILDIPTFRMTAKGVDQKKAKEEGWRKKGKYLVDRNGRHVIDYDKVQNNKSMVWKQWMLMKIGADLWAHIDRHSTDPSYGMTHYQNLLEAIQTLHGNVIGDEYAMRDLRVTENLFSKEQLTWLKRMSKTTNIQLANRQLWTDLFVGDRQKKTSLFGDSASLILGAIFKGVK